MIKKHEKLLFFHLILLSITILCGLQLNTNLNTFSNNSVSNCNENESINLKTSASEEWVRSFGSEGKEIANDVAVDSEGNIYVVGYEGMWDNSTLVKFSSSGVYQWNKTQKVTGYRGYESIFIDDFDYLYVSGYSWDGSLMDANSMDTILVKYDSDGNEIWNRTWGGFGKDHANDVAVNTQGDIYLAGYTGSFGANGYDLLLMKYNSTGHKEWNKTCDLSNFDVAWALCIDSQGNIFVGGHTNKSVGSMGLWSYDFVLTYWNGSNGDLLWHTTWGSEETEWFGDMAIDSQDFVYLVGTSEYLISSQDFCIVKYDNKGLPAWSKIWGSDYDDEGWSIGIDSSGNVYVVGNTNGYGAGLKDMYISKFNSDGAQQWYTLWDRGKNDYPTSIFIDNSTNDFYIAGYSDSFSLDSNWDIFLLKNPSLPITEPYLCVEIINQMFSTTEFVLTIKISSGIGLNPGIQSVQMWWNGTLVPPTNIDDLGNGLYNVSLSPIFVEPGQDPIIFNMTITSSNHRDKYFELKLAVAEPYLCVEIINQIFSTTEFVLTIKISSGIGLNPGIQSVQMWWNGTLVPPTNIDELGNGLYNVSLSPIFVEPGQDPIIFNMTITSSNHRDKYFELKLAVDPKAVKSTSPTPPNEADDDDNDEVAERLNMMLIILVISIVSGCALVGVVIIVVLIKKGKKD